MKSKNIDFHLSKVFGMVLKMSVFILIMSSFELFAVPKVATIVIDAGHGGKDAGAVGAKYKEKDIALAVALQFGKMIETNFSDVKVYYTRETDEFIELYKRPQIANKKKADLFISIHCNSTENKKPNSPYGFETFVMGLHKTEANLAVAKKENGVILVEKNYIDQYDGFDPNSPEAYIIFSLFQNAFLEQSLSFADKIQHQMNEEVVSIDRGVKQAGFWVLHGCAMPSVLTEIGFISNPKEEEFMGSKEGQAKISKALFEAFREYKYMVEGFNNQQAATSPDKAVSENKTPETPKSTDQSPHIVFKVQFASSSTNKSLNSPEFSKLEKVSKYQQDGLYKYTSGEETTLEDANELLKRVQAVGYKDAFVVVFKDDVRISTAEALKILKQK